jgi:peptide/nickel transport system substrate-binding protein/oligopeptide transport system substrate-binding protein
LQVPPTINEEEAGEKDKNPASKKGGALTLASYWPTSLDPCYLGNYVDFQISSCLFDTLVRYDYQTEKLVGAAAESWQVSPDGTVFTFKLVDGASFHNGDPVTSRDFEYAWLRLLEPDAKGLYSSNAFPLLVVEGATEFSLGEADAVPGIATPDDLTLEITLVKPFYDFPVTLSYPPLAPVPSSGAARNPSSFGKQPIGNGAFMMEEAFVGVGTVLKLVRFEEYYGQKALVNVLEYAFYAGDAPQSDKPEEELILTAYRQVDDENAGRTALEKAYEDFYRGILDYTEIPLDKIEEARASYGESRDGYHSEPGGQTLTGQEASTQFLSVNFLQEPLTDANVRKAVSYAINREALSEALTQGVYLEASGIVPPDVEGFRDGAWPASYYNSSRAKQCLQDAGYPDGKGLAPISLVYYGAFEKQLFELIQTDLADVGIRANLVQIGAPGQKSSTQDLIDNSASLTFAGWIIDYPLMESFLTPLFTTDGVYNPFGYSNALVDEGIQTARGIKSAKERVTAYQEVEDIIAEDMPLIPLFFSRLSAVCSDRTNDLYVRPDDLVEVANAWVSW